MNMHSTQDFAQQLTILLGDDRDEKYVWILTFTH